MVYREEHGACCLRGAPRAAAPDASPSVRLRTFLHVLPAENVRIRTLGQQVPAALRAGIGLDGFLVGAHPLRSRKGRRRRL